MALIEARQAFPATAPGVHAYEAIEQVRHARRQERVSADDPQRMKWLWAAELVAQELGFSQQSRFEFRQSLGHVHARMHQRQHDGHFTMKAANEVMLPDTIEDQGRREVGYAAK